MDLLIDLKNCKILYEKEDGDFKVLEVKSVEKYATDNGDQTEIVYLHDKGKKE